MPSIKSPGYGEETRRGKTLPGGSPAGGIGEVFSHDGRDFLVGGRVVRLYSGELHYFRVPRPYWRDRLAKARAMGLNAVCTYMPWNLHEPRPGEFDFDGDGGMLDVAGFVREAQAAGLRVILRPGPYICAEWDFGGLPGWLLADPGCRVRCMDPAYLAAVDRYVARVGEELAGLTCRRGGPIVMVQVENEYGSYANDQAYLGRMREMLVRAGLGDAGSGTLLFTSDGPEADMLGAGTIEGVLATANFGSKAAESLGALKQFRPGQPLMCGEFWCGWFDHWGRQRQGSGDPTACAREVRAMVEMGASFNLYMFHGGTNFGFTSGANYYDSYGATVTGYDYWAPLDEAGRVTAKYRALREILNGRHDGTEPAEAGTVAIEAGRFRFTGSAPLLENLPAGVRDAMVRPMERYGQYLGGAILYRTTLKGTEGTKLTIVEPRDYAVVFLNGERVGKVDRRSGEQVVELPAGTAGRLDILVWAMGRINYGPRLLDRKWITERVELGRLTLTGWEVFPLPMDGEGMKKLRYGEQNVSGPAFHRGEFELGPGEVGDTFLDMRGWKMGSVWVNGHNLGRYWWVGPQQTLYCPGCWLREGRNEIVVFDLEGEGRGRMCGLSEPVLDEVLPEG